MYFHSLFPNRYFRASSNSGFSGRTGTLYVIKMLLLSPLCGWATSNSSGRLFTVLAPKYIIVYPVSCLVVLAIVVKPLFSRQVVMSSGIDEKPGYSFTAELPPTSKLNCFSA